MPSFYKFTEEQKNHYMEWLLEKVQAPPVYMDTLDYKPPKVRFFRLKQHISRLLLPIVRWCDPDWLDQDHPYY